METQQKKSLKDLFQDKRFLWSLPIFIIIVGGLIYWTLQDEPQPTVQGSNINSNVPLGKADSTGNKNRLDLQSKAIEENPNNLTLASGTVGQGESGGMQAHIPGQNQYDRYVYGRRFNPTTSTGDGFSKLDSVVNPIGRNGNRRSSNPMPTNLTVGGPRIPLSERDVLMSDDQPDYRTSSDNRSNDQKKAEYQAALQKQQKLTTLLEEYKRDKEAKRLADEDKRKVYKATQEPVVGGLGESARGLDNRNSFYGLYSEDARKVQKAQLDAEVGTIRAMIFGDQDVVSSGRVRMRLLEPLVVRGITMPEGMIIYGIGGFSAERVTVRITALQYENHIFPVNLTVYDMDGMSGVYVPNIIGIQEARQAVGQIPGNINLNTGVGSSLNMAAMAGASAAQAGVQGVRQIVQKKTTLQKAHLKNNYYVLLRTGESGTGQQ